MSNPRAFALWGLAGGFLLLIGLGTAVMVQHNGPVRRAEKATDKAEATKFHPKSYDAQAMQLDPQDYEVMRPICTRCHSADRILHSRNWSGWQGIFQRMYRNGARATPDEWNHIYRFTGRHLTWIDVNDADEDELSAALDVDEKTAIAIVQHRADRKFESAADLEAVPGVNKALIEEMKPRLFFDKFAQSN